MLQVQHLHHNMFLCFPRYATAQLQVPQLIPQLTLSWVDYRPGEH